MANIYVSEGYPSVLADNIVLPFVLWGKHLEQPNSFLTPNSPPNPYIHQLPSSFLTFCRSYKGGYFS